MLLGFQEHHPDSRNTVRACTPKPGLGKEALEQGCGEVLCVSSLYSAPVIGNRHYCLVQRRHPKGCCLAMGNRRINPDENGEMIQMQRPLQLLKQAVFTVITHFTDENQRAGNGTDLPQVDS